MKWRDKRTFTVIGIPCEYDDNCEHCTDHTIPATCRHRCVHMPPFYIEARRGVSK